MKKLFVILAAVLISVSASAQLRVQAAASFGGYNKVETLDPEIGFTAKVLYDFQLSSKAERSYYLSAGVGYLMNNVSVPETNGKFTTHWLQVPVSLTTYRTLGRGDVYGSVGLYYAYAVSGQVSASGVSLDVIHNDISAVNIIKPHDFGYNVQLGYTFACNLGIYMGYTGGILNIAAQSDSDARTSLAELGVYYRF